MGNEMYLGNYLIRKNLPCMVVQIMLAMVKWQYLIQCLSVFFYCLRYKAKFSVKPIVIYKVFFVVIMFFLNNQDWVYCDNYCLS